MDQIKIGKFIAACRKNIGLTQMQLAEKLNITDRAVSKWETGKALPDVSLMLELCDMFKITVNDLLSGEVVKMENYNKELEKNLLEAVKQKEDSDKRLLRAEIVLGACCVVAFITSAIVAYILPILEWQKVLIILVGLLPLLVATPFALKIEQKAGYYQCKKCNHKYVPKYSSVFVAMHMGRTRYMTCPNCKKRSWQKKTISKD